MIIDLDLNSPDLGSFQVDLNDRVSPQVRSQTSRLSLGAGDVPARGEAPALPPPPTPSEAACGGPRLSFLPTPTDPPADRLPATGPKRGRKPLPVPLLGTATTSRYEAEKIYGRRRENGALKLRKLTRRHYEIIARHLAGQSGEDIHIAMGVSISTISRVLNDPLAQEILQRAYRDRQSELDALAGLAVGAVRHALDRGSTSEKLAAVDKFAKLKQAIAPETNPAQTAEDFARAIVQNAQNVQINFNGR